VSRQAAVLRRGGAAGARGGRRGRGAVAPRRRCTAPAAAEAATPSATSEPEFYDFILEKPLMVKFTRGNDGKTYVVGVPTDAKYACFEVGDRVVKVSASFGDDVWDAESYGQTMYAMKTRSGNVFVQMEKRFGDMSPMEFVKVDDGGFRNERAGGNYGAGTQEKQRANYAKAKEVESRRTKMFEEAIRSFEGKDFQQALITFEEIIGLEPPNYMGDNFAKTTELFVVSQYNAACCYAQMSNVDAGLEALEKALKAGFDNYKQVRNDPSLKQLQADERFTPLINRFDEPFINESAIKAFKNLFGGGK